MTAEAEREAAEERVEGEPHPPQLLTGLWLLTGLVLLAPLALHAYLGSYSRPLADDFCTWGRLNELGFWASQGYWYLNWSGRFSFTALMTASHVLGPSIAPVLPGLVLALWAGAAAWTLWPALPFSAKWIRGLAAGVLAGTLLGGVLGAAPNLYQSVYWQTGVMTYLVPLLVFTSYLGWLVRRFPKTAKSQGRSRWREVTIALGVPLLAGGFSETFALLQVALLALITAVIWLVGPRWRAKWSGLGVVGAALALAIVAAAPGNEVRSGLVGQPAPLPVVVARSVQDAYIFGAQMVNYQLPVLISLALVPLAVGILAGRGGGISLGSGILLVGGLPLAAFFGVALVMLPSEYALSSYPDGRVLINATFVVAAAIILWALIIGAAVGPRFPAGGRLRHALSIAISVAALAAVGVQAARAVRQGTQLLPDARQFAAGWDQRHEAVLLARRQGEMKQAVASLAHMGGLAEIAREPDVWINRCFADAYGIRSVEAK